jgi:cell division protein ZipA
MENIRLILLLIGAVIVLGIYLFSRMQGQWHWPRISLPKLPGRRSTRNTRRQRGSLPDIDDIDADVGFDPELDGEFAADIDRIGLQVPGDPLERVNEPAPERTIIRKRAARPPEKQPAAAENKPPASDKIFTLFVMAPKGVPFRGPMLPGAFAEAQLEYGDMQIFHRSQPVDGRDQHLFSVANMKEPGYFDLDALEDFSSEGLVLFLQIAPGLDAVRAFDAMVESATILAEELGGTVCDATRSVLTKQTISHLREEVIGCQLQHRVIKTAS